MKVECPRCHTHVEKPLQGNPICPTCGFGAPEGGTGQASATPPVEPPAPSSQWTDQPSSFSQPAASDPPHAQAWGGSTQPKQGLAITALVLGILGICTVLVYVGLPLGIAALVTGIIGFKRAKARPTEFGGRGMALAGIITGAIAILFSVIWIVFILVASSALVEALCEDDPDHPLCDNRAPAQATMATPLTLPLLWITTALQPTQTRHAG